MFKVYFLSFIFIIFSGCTLVKSEKTKGGYSSTPYNESLLTTAVSSKDKRSLRYYYLILVRYYENQGEKDVLEKIYKLLPKYVNPMPLPLAKQVLIYYLLRGDLQTASKLLVFLKDYKNVCLDQKQNDDQLYLIYRLLGNYEQALQCANFADKNNLEIIYNALLNQAWVYFEKGDYKKAINKLSSAQKLLKKDARAYYAELIFSIINKDINRAKRVLEQVNRYFPTDISFYLLKSIYLAENKDWQKLEDLKDKISKKSFFKKININALGKVSILSRIVNNLTAKKDKPTFSVVLDLNKPISKELKIAYLNFLVNDFQQSQIWLLKEIFKNSDNGYAHYLLGNLMVVSNSLPAHYFAAIEHLLRVHSSSKYYEKSRLLASAVYKKLGKIDKAIEVLHSALKESDNSQGRIVIELISLYQESRKNKKALQIAKQYLSKFKNNPGYLYTYGFLLFANGRKKEAIDVMENIIDQFGDYAAALNFLAYELAQEGRELKRALTLINKALSLEPNNAYYLDTLAWVYYKQGKKDKAEKTMAQALALVPDDVVLLYHYAEILESSGKKTLARNIAQRILTISGRRELTNEDEVNSVERAKDMLKRLNK